MKCWWLETCALALPTTGHTAVAEASCFSRTIRRHRRRRPPRLIQGDVANCVPLAHQQPTRSYKRRLRQVWAVRVAHRRAARRMTRIDRDFRCVLNQVTIDGPLEPSDVSSD